MENGIVFIAKGIYASSIGRHCLLPVKGKTSAANFQTVLRGRKSRSGRWRRPIAFLIGIHTLDTHGASQFLPSRHEFRTSPSRRLCVTGVPLNNLQSRTWEMTRQQTAQGTNTAHFFSLSTNVFVRYPSLLHSLRSINRSIKRKKPNHICYFHSDRDRDRPPLRLFL